MALTQCTAIGVISKKEIFLFQFKNFYLVELKISSVE